MADPRGHQGLPSWSKFFHFHTVLENFKIRDWNTLPKSWHPHQGISGSATDLAFPPSFPVESSFRTVTEGHLRLLHFISLLSLIYVGKVPKKGSIFPNRILFGALPYLHSHPLLPGVRRPASVVGITLQHHGDGGDDEDETDHPEEESIHHPAERLPLVHDVGVSVLLLHPVRDETQVL